MARKKARLTLGLKGRRYRKKSQVLTPRSTGKHKRSQPATPVAKRFCPSSTGKRDRFTPSRSPTKKKARHSLCSPLPRCALRFHSDTEEDDMVMDNTVDANTTEEGAMAAIVDSEEEDTVTAEVDSEEEEIMSAVKKAQQLLLEMGKPDIVKELIKAVSKGNLDPNKVTFQIILETLQFLNLTDVRAMRYSQMTMDFWKIILNKCGGAAIRLLSGWRMIGSVLATGNKTKLPGRESSTILAIPSVPRLLNHGLQGINSKLRPGVHDELLRWLAENSSENTSFILSFDGRLVQMNSGAVDLAGYEIEGCTALERDKQEEEEIGLCKALKMELDNLDLDKAATVHKLRDLITLLSTKKQVLRVIKEKKEYALRLAKQAVSGDWRKSKCARLISHLMAIMYQIDTTLAMLEDSLDGLGKASSEISGAGNLWVEGPVVDMTQQQNYLKLAPCSSQAELSADTLYWQQRGENWRQLRSSVPITGSQLHKGAGCDTLIEAKRLHKHWTDGEQLPEPSDKVKAAMKAGVENEPHAVATIVSKFLPSLYPTVEFREVGCCKYSMGNVTIVDSPDGSCHERNSELKSPAKLAVEIKHVTTSLPQRVRPYNVIQCLAHCKALQTDSCLLFYHTRSNTALYRVKYDDELWTLVTQQIDSIYGPDGKPPKRVTPELKCLRERIKSHAASSELMAEFKSTINVELGPYIRKEESPYYMPRGSRDPTDLQVSEAINICDKAIAALKECQELTRPWAKEVLQFLLCDSDRMWSQNQIYGCPVAYFLKGPSLPAAQAHVLVEAVLTKAEEQGLYIPAVSADGAFEYMVARDANNTPNTKLSFQKKLWKEIASMEKRTLAIIITTLVSDAWNILYEKMKISQTGNAVSLERYVKWPCPTTATWALKTCDPDDKKNTSEKTTDEGDLYEQLLDSLPEDARESLEQFCEEYPAFRAQLRQPSQEGSGGVQSVERNVDSSSLPAGLNEENQTDVRTEGDEENQQVAATEIRESREAGESEAMPISTEVLEQVKHKIQEKTALDWDPGVSMRAFLEDSNRLNNLNLEVLKDILRTMKEHAKGTVKLSVKKADVIKQIRSIMKGDTLDFAKKRLRQPKSLLHMCEAAVKACPSKAALSASLANHVGRRRRLAWEETRTCPKLKLTSAGGNLPEEIECFYCPPLTKRGYLQGTVIDPHHIRTNIRGSVLRNQIRNVDLEGFKKVADGARTKLKRVMLTECVDMQSKEMCDVLFSSDVATELDRLGYKPTADFVRVMHGWHRANDCPGLDAEERVILRLRMRDWLLDGVNFDVYPPPGRYIQGIYVTTWEAFVSQIDMSIQAERLSPKMHRCSPSIPSTRSRGWGAS